MLNPPVLGWYPLREAIARYLDVFGNENRVRKTVTV